MLFARSSVQCQIANPFVGRGCGNKVLQFVRQTNTVNFFQRRTEDVLWATTTGLTVHGARKGRSQWRQKKRRLDIFYKIGRINSSPLGVRYPGLNTKISDVNDRTQPIFIEEPTGEQRGELLNTVKTAYEKSRKTTDRRIFRERLGPLQRGFSGGTFLGQRLGPPPPNIEEGINYDDFECICLEVKRLCAMHRSFGRVYTRRALVFVGNGKGVGGWALGRASPFKSNIAIAKAIRQACRNLIHVELFEDRTIYQDFFGEYRNTRVFAQRREPNSGVVAHPRIQKICQLLGIKDIYVRVEGSTHNYVGICYAFMTGLINQETHQQLADRTRLHVVELSPNNMFFPKIVASPMKSSVKTDDEIEPKERLRMDDFYGEGRYPLHWGPSKSFAHVPGHLNAQWKKHPYRNMEERIVRLLADGVVRRWTRRERLKWAQREHERVKNGQKPLPMGIGLSDWVPMENEEESVLLGNPVPGDSFPYEQVDAMGEKQ